MTSLLIYLPYNMAFVSVCVCVRVHVPYKSYRERCVLRASLMYAFRHAYGLPYKMATFIATKGLLNTVYSRVVVPGAGLYALFFERECAQGIFMLKCAL